MRTDEQLFAAYRDDNCEASLSELYQRYSRPLRAFAKRRACCDTLTADELFQSVMLRAVNSKHRFEQGKKLAPWLYVIAERLCLDWLRAKSRRSNVLPLTQDASCEDEPTTETSEETQKALKLLAKLPANLRKIVKFSIIDGLPSREVGPKCGVSYRHAQNLLRAALGALRAEMG